MDDPTLKSIRKVRYAPPGEYVKDHGLIHHKGAWHLFSISGGIGMSWEDRGHEERISHSTSADLVTWDLQGHPVRASGVEGYHDQHMAVAPHVVENPGGGFCMFYSGWRHPHKRPDFKWEGNLQSLYMATSPDLDSWEVPERVAPRGIRVEGDPIRGRDPHVLRDGERDRWLLYYTHAAPGSRGRVHVAESRDLDTWRDLGPALCLDRPDTPYDPAESPFVLRHPRSGRYLMFLNWDYAVSDDPTRFPGAKPLPFLSGIGPVGGHEEGVGVGFAREIIRHEGRDYMSGVLGPFGRFVLGFTPFTWTGEFLEIDG